MNYKTQHITNKNKLTNRIMTPQYLTIHSTANKKSTAQNERDNLNRSNNTSSTGFHIVVDDKEAIECIPLDTIAYHAGDGANGTGNIKSIGMEICESGNRAKTLQNAVEVAAKILYEKGWGIEKLKRHYDWSGKNCPRILNYNNWEGWRGFKLQVERELNRLRAGEKSKANQEPSKWAKDDWEWGIKNKITDGSNPKEIATREEVVSMIRRTKEVKQYV